MALVGGLGLLGLLITIAILALLANRVLSGTDDAAEVLTDDLPAELSSTTVPGSTDATASTEVPGGEAGGALNGLTDPAAAAACQVNRNTLELAAQAYEIASGSPPPDQQALVDAGYLAEVLATHELGPGPAGVQITGVGDCAGQ